MKNTFSKGFTLVELLIVITILAALAAAVVVVLNPAELLAQARDSQRLNDMGVVRDALALYLTQGVTAGNIIDLSFAGACSVVGTNDGCCTHTACPIGPFAQTSTPRPNLRAVDGSGWIDVNFNQMLGGSPLSTLPMDPTNNAIFNYHYIAGATHPEVSFELNARLESERYRGMMINDGGNRSVCEGAWTATTCFYEVGNDPGLDLGA